MLGADGLSEEYASFARSELKDHLSNDERAVKLTEKAKLQPADEVTLRTVLALPIPARLNGVGRNGTPPVEVVRRFIAAKKAIGYEEFLAYLRSNMDAEKRHKKFEPGRRARREGTAWTVRSRE